MRVIVTGACGRMGREICFLLRERGDCVIGVDSCLKSALCYDTLHYAADTVPIEESTNGMILNSLSCIDSDELKADVIIDFSFHSSIKEIAAYAVRRNIPLVIGTTGHTYEEKGIINAASEKIAVFYAQNFSFGMNVVKNMVSKCAKLLEGWECEITEVHHSGKKDAPGGTALVLAQTVVDSRRKGKAVFNKSSQRERLPSDVGISALRIGNTIGKHIVIFSNGNETVTVTHEAHNRKMFADGAVMAAEFIIGKQDGLYGMDDLVIKNDFSE